MHIVDFYVGRGESAEYIGSGDFARLKSLSPSDFQSCTSVEYTEQDYRSIAEWASVVREWPHAHADSADTAWTYAYDTGSVYVYRKGVEMMVIRCNTHRTVRRPNGGPVLGGSDTVVREWRPVNNFPAMKEATTA